MLKTKGKPRGTVGIVASWHRGCLLGIHVFSAVLHQTARDISFNPWLAMIKVSLRDA